MSCRNLPNLTDPDSVRNINNIASNYINEEIHPDTEMNAAAYIQALPTLKVIGEAGLVCFAPES